ncbi:hypothetical protein GOODEAATRI_027875, partial [Goodea atripinnis]
LTEVLNQLWDLDSNRLKPGTDYRISLQGKAGYVAPGSNSAKDRANAPLFAYVNEEKLKNIKTYAHFISLLDNYEMSTGVSETVTSEELQENRLFIDAIMETEVMKCAHKYLVKKGQSPADPGKFKRQLYDIWFQLYHRDRSGGEDSCGFEHVFVGETKHGKEIMGLHNWVQFYLQEKHGHVDYKGYKARDNKSTVRTSCIFIGISPEFEVALFTIIFLMSSEKMTSVVVKVDEYMLELVVHRHGSSIGTSYPKLLSSNNRDL